MLHKIMPMAGQKYKGHTKQSFWMSVWSGRAFAHLVDSLPDPWSSWPGTSSAHSQSRSAPAAEGEAVDGYSGINELESWKSQTRLSFGFHNCLGRDRNRLLKISGLIIFKHIQTHWFPERHDPKTHTEKSRSNLALVLLVKLVVKIWNKLLEIM